MSDLYLGNTGISKVYLGDTLIYEKGGGDSGDEDNNWYMLVCNDIDGNTAEIKVYFYQDGLNKSQWFIYGSAGNIYVRNRYLRFEYKGESYYVDNLNDGDHTLSKQGSPAYYEGKFMHIEITKNGNDFVFNCIED